VAGRTRPTIAWRGAHVTHRTVNGYALRLTGHKTRSVFERYNIVIECDLVEAAKKLNALHTTVRLKPDTTYDADGHNLGTATRQSKSRLRMSL
jgi:hypothetical protein